MKAFDDDISGAVLPAASPLRDEWSCCVVEADHGTFRLGRIRRFDRWWYFKALVPQCRGSEQYRRVLRKEFDIMIGLDHPGIIRAADFRDIPDIGPAILMEYSPGVTFDAWLEAGPSARRRRKVFAAILSAVVYLHSRGIVHRDLKPQNILVENDGTVKIIDFGLSDARWSALEMPGGGTPGYSAPEQLSGEEGDTRADVYSLGIILNIIRLPKVTPDGVAALIAARRCCGRPERRYADAGALKKALKRWRIALWGLITVALAAAIALVFYPQKNDVETSPKTGRVITPEVTDSGNPAADYPATVLPDGNATEAPDMDAADINPAVNQPAANDAPVPVTGTSETPSPTTASAKKSGIDPHYDVAQYPAPPHPKMPAYARMHPTNGLKSITYYGEDIPEATVAQEARSLRDSFRQQTAMHFMLPTWDEATFNYLKKCYLCDITNIYTRHRNKDKWGEREKQELLRQCHYNEVKSLPFNSGNPPALPF